MLSWHFREFARRGDVQEFFRRIFSEGVILHGEMSRGMSGCLFRGIFQVSDFSRELSRVGLQIPFRITSLRAVVVICATRVNIQTHTLDRHGQLLTMPLV